MHPTFFRTQLLRLIKKHIKGKTTSEEEALLNDYYQAFERNDNWVAGLPAEKIERLKKEMKAVIWSAALVKQQPKVLYIFKTYKHALAAASVTGVILISSLVYFGTQTNGEAVEKNQATSAPKPAVIKPGTDKATLTLANGLVVLLDSANSRSLALDRSVPVTNANGTLTYNAGNKTGQELSFNTLTTPHGGQYQVVLADGTKVWLNAASSLTYPVSFTGNERKVQLAGEAYFEVAKNKAKSFIVQVKDVRVNVLGTHFNIMSYDDEGKIATTLLEGSVRIAKANDAVTIMPGQQMLYYNTGKKELNSNVDVEEVIAWKNGRFSFAGADIKTIMRQLSRWYNVEVVYEGPLPEAKFGGVLKRKDDIRHLLKVFELTGKVHFKIEGTKISVMK